MKFKYLAVALASFILVGCGEPEPSKEELTQRFTKEYEGLKLDSIDLKKTDEKGDLKQYAVEGIFITETNLYENLNDIGFGNAPKFYKLIEKSGQSIDFTATLIAQGNDKTGWKVDFSKLTSKLPGRTLMESEIDINSPNVFVINADNFKDKINSIETVIKDHQGKIDTKNQEITKLTSEQEAAQAKADGYWGSFNFGDGNITNRYQFESFLREQSEANKYREANEPWRKMIEYDKDVFNPIVKKFGYGSNEYKEAAETKKRIEKELRTKFDAEIAPLEAKYQETLKQYLDAHSVLQAKVSDIKDKKSAVENEIRTLENEIESFKKVKSIAIEKGYLKP